MLMLREVIRVVGQSLRYASHHRSLGLLVFVVLGGLLVVLALAATFASPVLIYPLL